MSFLARYMKIAQRVDSRFVENLRCWFERWPEAVQFIPDGKVCLAGTDSVTNRFISDQDALRDAASRISRDDLLLYNDRGFLCIGVEAENRRIVPFQAELYPESTFSLFERLLFGVGRARRSALEGLISDVNFCVARRVISEARAIVCLPRVTVDREVEIMPRTMIMLGSANTPVSSRQFWATLDQFGFEPGMTELRPLGGVREPTVVDLKDPEGVEWAMDLRRRWGGISIVPVASTVIPGVELSGRIADCCVEFSYPQNIT